MIAGAVAGGVVGLAAGPGGAVVGAVGGALAGAAAERAMHVDEDLERMAAGEEQAPWVAPSAAETADPTVAAMLAVTDDHEHRFEDGRCSCGAAI